MAGDLLRRPVSMSRADRTALVTRSSRIAFVWSAARSGGDRLLPDPVHPRTTTSAASRRILFIKEPVRADILIRFERERSS
jgi:hypothetical protein